MKQMKRQEVVVITGASAGVGRATVLEFARRGARLGLVARGRAGLMAAKREAEAAGASVSVAEADVADAAAVERAAAQFESEFGPIDIWINNAMVSVFSPFMEMSAEEYRRVTEVTYLGYVHGTQSALRRMISRRRGTIVQVGSTLAYRGIPLQSAYCGAKHAIQGMNESVRSELFHEKLPIHITMVQLPAVNTPQFGWVKSRLRNKAQPVPPIYQPEVAARAIHWAAHHRRRELNVGVMTSLFIMGNYFFSGIGDRYLARTGYKSQQTSEPEDPARPHNLWAPVDAESDYGAHGRFGERARPRSRQLWVTTHRGMLAAAVLVFLALGAVLF